MWNKHSDTIIACILVLIRSDIQIIINMFVFPDNKERRGYIQWRNNKNVGGGAHSTFLRVWLFLIRP